MNTLISLFSTLITLVIKATFLIENYNVKIKSLLRMPTLA